MNRSNHMNIKRLKKIMKIELLFLKDNHYQIMAKITVKGWYLALTIKTILTFYNF
jgi:hypothetical protein